MSYSSVVSPEEQQYQALADKTTTSAQQQRKEIDAKIAENHRRTSDPKFRQALFSTFAPTFCFHKTEDSFPMVADDYIEQVVLAKHKHYIENGAKLTAEEKKELNVINQYFINPDGSFNKNYASHREAPDFQEVLPTRRLLEERDINWAKARYEELSKGTNLSDKDNREKECIEKALCKSVDGKYVIDESKFEKGLIKDVWSHGVIDIILNKSSNEAFLTFDEKKYGYPIESKVPWNNKPKKDGAPAYTTVIPTPDGVLIKYERFYSISSAIPGTKWLYKLLPHKLSEKAKHFAVHAGDWEGVMVKVNIDKNGNATLGGMQSFAHGRDGAQYLEADKLTYDAKGRPCVFVGAATHGSYLSNHVGRTKFLDKVGNHIQETPTEFVDISHEQIKSKTFPKWGRVFQRMGSPSSPAPEHSGSDPQRSYNEFVHDAGEWNRYKPKMILDNLWNKIKSVFIKSNTPSNSVVEYDKVASTLVKKSPEKIRGRSKSQSHVKEVSKDSKRRHSIGAIIEAGPRDVTVVKASDTSKKL